MFIINCCILVSSLAALAAGVPKRIHHNSLQNRDSQAHEEVFHSYYFNESAPHFSFDDTTGFVIVAGGVKAISSSFVKSVFALDLVSGQWRSLPDLPIAGHHKAMIENGGQVYVMAGWHNEKCSAATNFLSVSKNMWGDASSMAGSYNVAAVASSDSSIYVVERSVLYTTNVKTMSSDGVWSSLPSAHLYHSYSVAAVVNGNIYVCQAGYFNGNDCEYFDNTNQTWNKIADMKVPRYAPGAVSLNGYLFMIGGAKADNERYDPSTGEWSFFASTITNPLNEAAVATDGKYIFAIGGYTRLSNGKYVVLNSAEVYIPDLDVWQRMPDYPTPIGGASAVYVANMPV